MYLANIAFNRTLKLIYLLREYGCVVDCAGTGSVDKVSYRCQAIGSCIIKLLPPGDRILGMWFVGGL